MKPAIRIMPAAFGPAGGPRQAPGDPDFTERPIRFIRHIVRFETDAKTLESLLPDALLLRGTPTVQFHFFCLRDIPWLAGRGYNLLSMMIPVRHVGDGGTTDALYQAVIWKNLGDPIITGREQLGHPKLYAQLPEPRRWNDDIYLRASWEDFTFAEMQLSPEEEAPPEMVAEFTQGVGAGIISHKYIPRSGAWDQADADYLTLSPVPGASNTADPQPAPSVRRGKGQIRFIPPRWQDMPTQYHIVQKLAAIEQRNPIDALLIEGTTFLDFFDQTILG